MSKTYTVTWSEVSTHKVDVTAEDLANLLGVDVDELDELDDEDTDLPEGLADALAEFDDDGFQFLTREDISVKERG